MNQNIKCDNKCKGTDNVAKKRGLGKGRKFIIRNALNCITFSPPKPNICKD